MGSRVGVQVAGTTPPGELAAIVAEAERLGYGELWLAEDYFDLGGIASVATALSATSSVSVGLGIASVRVRHPALMAMELATLAGAFPGRFFAGLGHGVTDWLRQMGLRPASSLRSLREGTTAIRALLDGEVLDAEGEYASFSDVRLRFPPEAHLPIYFGVHGPRSLELAGELADGTLLGWFSSPEYVSWARERIDVGRERAGRTDPHQLVALCILSISDDDPEAARHELAAWASASLVEMSPQPGMAATAAGVELARAVGELPPEGGTLPSDLRERFMAMGDREACAAMVERLFDAGADRVVLVPNPAGVRSSAGMMEQIRRAAVLAVERP